MLKKILSLAFLNAVFLSSYGQSIEDIKTPKVVPPSPDAAALGRYGQIPVDKATGVASIEIPLYEVKTPRFTLPITLSYHNSGVKVSELSTWVGAGWVLNAGGLITRSMVGMDDICPFGYYTSTIKKASQIQWPSDAPYISDALNNRLDVDPDNFFFNFNNYAGAFVFGYDKKPVLIPYKPILVHFDSSSRNFDITDENGNLYYFNTKEMVYNSVNPFYTSGISTWYLTQMVSADRSDTLTFNYVADANQLVDYSFSYSQTIGQTLQGGIFLPQPMIISSSNRQFNPVRIRSITFNGGRVDFISKGGRIDDGNFSLDSVIVFRQDIVNKTKYTRVKRFKLLTDYFYSGVSSDIYGNIVRDTETHRLKLTGLQEIGSDNVVIKSHQFGYNTTPLPYLHSCSQDEWGYYNGKTNGSLMKRQTVVINSGTLSPTVVTIGDNSGIPPYPNRSADRSSSLEFMQACVLNKITYPTGGYTQFTYGCHQYIEKDTTYLPISANAYGDGGSHPTAGTMTTTYTPTTFNLANGGNIFQVSFKTIAGAPAPSVQVIRASDNYLIYTLSYSYSAANPEYKTTAILELVAGVEYKLKASAINNTVNGYTYAEIKTTYPSITTNVRNMGGLRISKIQNFNADNSLVNTETYTYGVNDESGIGVPITFFPTYQYPKSINEIITNYLDDTVCVMQGIVESVYNSSSIYPLSTLSGSPMAYPTVTVYHGNGAFNTGKSVYRYNIYPDSVMKIDLKGGLGIKVKPISTNWKNGEPIWEGHYRNNGNGIYTLVQSTTNEFDLIYKKGGLGSRVAYTIEPRGFLFSNPILQPGGAVSTTPPCSNGWITWTQDNFSWSDYPISTGNRVLKSSHNQQYANDGSSMSVTTQYYYDNTAHMFPTRVVTTNSKGESFTKVTNYPQDMVAASKDPTGIYTSMSAVNMISFPIEQYQSKNNPSSQLFYEKHNYGSFGANMIKLRSIEWQTLSNPSEVRLQYLGYDSRGNVGTLMKDTGPPISYHWGYNQKYPVAEVVNAATSEFFYEGYEESAAATQGYAHSGQYYFAGRTYTVNWSPPNNRNYVISYWYLNDLGVWNYVPEQPFTGTIVLNNGVGYDDIRIYPKDAQMKTYTYAPLFGVTSETDYCGLTKYFRYDNAGRLMDTRDNDNNIVKTFQYNYQH